MALPNPVFQMFGREVRGCSPPHPRGSGCNWSYRPGINSGVAYLLAMSFQCLSLWCGCLAACLPSAVLGPFLGPQCLLGTSGLPVLSSSDLMVKPGGVWGYMGSPLVGRSMPNLLVLMSGPAGQGSPSPSTSALLKQGEVLSTRSPSANGQMAPLPTGPGGAMAPRLQMPQPGTNRLSQSQQGIGGRVATGLCVQGLEKYHQPWEQCLSGMGVVLWDVP